MKLMKKDNRNLDLKLSIALMASFVILTFQYLILIIFNLIDTSVGSLVQTISKIIVAFFFIYALPAMWKRVSKIFIMVYGISILIFLVQFLFFIPNQPLLMDLIFPIFFMSLPAFIYSLALRDLLKFQEVSKIAGNIVFILGVIISIFIFSGNATVGTYSMSLSYYMLLPALLFLGAFLDKYSFLSFFFFLITLLIILSLGSRGALLCIVVYVLLKLIRIDLKSSRKEIIFQLGIFVTIVAMTLQFENILTWLNVQFTKYGISSRTLNLLQQNDIYLSGRDNIASVVIEGLKKNPITGLGLAGDKILAGTYSHNFFVEVISNYGVIVGLIIIVGVLLMTIRSLFISHKILYDLTSLWLSLGFIHLMVSGTYLNEMKFWMFLGIIGHMNFNKKRMINQ